ncbi:MAG: PDZ domain-containing protein [Longimicrobiales bacterium]
MMRRIGRVLALSLSVAPLAAAAPSVGAAQVAVAGAARGWIGISVDVRTSVTQGGRAESLAVIDDVRPGSPAARAGLRVGDVLVSIDGEPYELGFAQVVEGIRPGDRVRMVVERGGQRLELRVVAADRPAVVVEAPRWRLAVEVDSMAETMYRAMDSLRVELIRADGGREIVRVGGPDGRTVLRRIEEGPGEPAGLRPPGSAFDVSPERAGDRELHVGELRPPFGFFLFEGHAQDSLRQEMERLNEEIRRVRTEELKRLRERGARASEPDPVLAALERRRESLAARSTELRRAMESAALDAARSADAVVVRAPAPPAADPARQAPASFRPLAPYVLGQNRAAGAEVVDLQPALADYFGVTGGVLVVDVPAGTLAATAGLQPGDVIVRVAGREVDGIRALRDALGASAGATTLALVRKGRSMEVVLPR